MKESLRKTIIQSLAVLLRPVVRLCLSHSVKFQDFSEMAKGVFVDAAKREVERAGLAPSASRLSIMTGLQRRDVIRILDRGAEPPLEDNLITRVIGQWVSDKRFLDKRGKPRRLRTDGKSSEFAKLVSNVSNDLNHHTVLFELERLGAAKRIKNSAQLQVTAREERTDHKQVYGMLATDTEDLMAAVEENFELPDRAANLHARTVYDNVQIDAIPQIRKWLLAFGKRMHLQARRFLSKYDLDITPRRGKSGGVRIVLGTFSRVDEAPEKDEARKPVKGESK